jgi:hypothetical protein
VGKRDPSRRRDEVLRRSHDRRFAVLQRARGGGTAQLRGAPRLASR